MVFYLGGVSQICISNAYNHNVQNAKLIILISLQSKRTVPECYPQFSLSNHIAWLSAPSSVIQALESSLMWLVLMMSLVLLLRLKLVSYLDVGLFAACCCCLGGFLGKSTQLLGNVFQFLIFKCATMPPYSAAWRHTFSI